MRLKDDSYVPPRTYRRYGWGWLLLTIAGLVAIAAALLRIWHA